MIYFEVVSMVILCGLCGLFSVLNVITAFEKKYLKNRKLDKGGCYYKE